MIFKRFSGKQKKVKGYIGYYELENWWFSEFTEDERKYMNARYDRDDWESHRLTQGEIHHLSQPAAEWLNGFITFFRRKEDKSIAERIHNKIIELGELQSIDKPGYYKGRHFTSWVYDVKELKREGKIDETEKLLIELVKATEEENELDGYGVAPWYYEELAKVYRKQKDYDKEVRILERYANIEGDPQSKFQTRLDRARELQQKEKSKTSN